MFDDTNGCSNWNLGLFSVWMSGDNHQQLERNLKSGNVVGYHKLQVHSLGYPMRSEGNSEHSPER